MIQELQLRILPEQAANEQSLKQIVAQETGAKSASVWAVRILKRSIDARQRTIYVNLKVRAFIDELPTEAEYHIKMCRAGSRLSWWAQVPVGCLPLCG